MVGIRGHLRVTKWPFLGGNPLQPKQERLHVTEQKAQWLYSTFARTIWPVVSCRQSLCRSNSRRMKRASEHVQDLLSSPARGDELIARS